MSVFSAIVNKEQPLISTVVSPPTLSGGDTIYVTIPWVPNSYIDKIVLSSTENFSDVQIKLLSDGASYRLASTDNQQGYIVHQITQTGNFTQWYAFDVQTSYSDNYHCGYMYVLIESPSANFTTGSVFTITAYGHKQLSLLHNMDYSPYKNDKNFRALKLTSGNTQATDLTAMLAGNGPPTENGYAPVCFASTSDTMYFGSDKSFSALEFQIYSGAQTTGQFTWQYYRADTSTWTTFTPIDNTSDGQATPGEFNYSGTFALPTMTGWGPAQLSTDPLKIMIDEIIAGTRPPMGMTHNPSRYWIRATPTTLNGTLKLGFARTLNI